MLRIPTAADTPPPLVISLRSVAAEAATAIAEQQATLRTKSRKSEEHGWDRNQNGGQLPVNEEKRQMFWWFIGGTTLFTLILALVLMSMLREVKAKADIASQPPTPPAPVATPPVKDPATDAELSNAAFLKKAEALAKQFMEASRIDQLLPLVRNPHVAEGRMKKFYPDGKVDAPGISAFNINNKVLHFGPVTAVMVRTRDFVAKPLYFFESPSGIKLDWESWVGWSEISWNDFIEIKPRTPKLFRLTLSAVQYYNFFFSDEQKWQSYRIESPDRKHSIYGYVERNSPINARLQMSTGMKQTNLTLALRYPQDALSSNQVFIDGFIAEGWVLETEPTP